MEHKQHKKINFISYEKLHLDNDHNPRLPSRLMGMSNDEILQYMILDANVIDLMASIGENGYFSGEPLLVIPHESNDEYIVIEGNRRLSAVMLLSNPSIVTIKQKALAQIIDQATEKPFPDELPVIIHDTREEIINYLGYRHITGVKPWDSLAKAKYLRQLYDDSNINNIDERCRDLARSIGSRADYVKKLLCALSIYKTIEENAFYKIPALDEETISFSLITTSIGYSGIKTFIGLETEQEIEPKNVNNDRLADLTDWMFNKKEGKTRLGESRNLKQLSSIVENETALIEFRSGESLESAYYFSEGAKESVINSIRKAHDYLELAYKYAKEITLAEQEHMQLSKIITTTKAIIKQTQAEE